MNMLMMIGHLSLEIPTYTSPGIFQVSLASDDADDADDVKFIIFV